MAPEQAAGQAKFVGPPADVGALGVILYECLTGTRPFRTAEVEALLALACSADPVSPRAVVPSVPRDLERICLKCLEKDPADRYTTARALADDLRRFRRGEPIAARAAGVADSSARRRSAPTGRGSSPTVPTRRPGCGTPGPAPNSSRSRGMTVSSPRRRSARTGHGSLRGATTRRRRCGTRRRAHARRTARGAHQPAAELAHLLHVFEQVCQTLAYAHRQGVVHRDLKPSNVMVGEFGEVQVMDWGLAKVLRDVRPDPRDGAEEPAPDSGRTQAGQVIRTPQYMPPEQARGEHHRVDPRADVYALGAIFCEILTGQPPHAGAPDALAAAQQGRLDDAWRRLDACGADEEVITLAKRCLVDRPESRPADAAAVVKVLATYREAVEARLRASERNAAQWDEVLSGSKADADLGVVCARSLRRYGDALLLYQEATRLDPNYELIIARARSAATVRAAHGDGHNPPQEWDNYWAEVRRMLKETSE